MVGAGVGMIPGYGTPAGAGVASAGEAQAGAGEALAGAGTILGLGTLVGAGPEAGAGEALVGPEAGVGINPSTIAMWALINPEGGTPTTIPWWVVVLEVDRTVHTQEQEHPMPGCALIAVDRILTEVPLPGVPEVIEVILPDPEGLLVRMLLPEIKDIVPVEVPDRFPGIMVSPEVIPGIVGVQEVVHEAVFTTVLVAPIEVQGYIADLEEVPGVIPLLHGLPLEVVGIEVQDPEAVVVDSVLQVLHEVHGVPEALEAPGVPEALEVLEVREVEVVVAVPREEAEAVAEEEIRVQVQS